MTPSPSRFTVTWVVLTALLLSASCHDDAVDLPGDDDGVSTRYVVLTTLHPSDPYYPAVTKLRAHRAATVQRFDPADLAAVKSALKAADARHVALVMKPRELDINFARRFFMMSTELDDDPFSDISYGYITGATAADAVAFVERIIKAEKEGLANKPLTASGYSASTINHVYTTASSYLKHLSPSSYSHIYLKSGDPGTRAFFDSNAHRLSGVKLLDIGNNGDPHMLWLFDDGNSVKDTWSYSPNKVESPPVKRQGLTSDDIRKLKLYPAVAFNGACHSGVLKRTLVEGDIMATFGDTGGKVEFFEMSDDFSFALSVLRAGVIGYFAPIGSNNANDKSEEIYNAFRYGEPLGEVHKRISDGVVMGFLGNRPKLRVFNSGESAYQYETLPSGSYQPSAFGLGRAAMLSGKANRIYFGDPLLDPFGKHTNEALRLTRTELTDMDGATHRLKLSFNKPAVYFPLWDKFHDGKARVYTTVELPAAYGDGAKVVLESVTEGPKPSRVIHAVERRDGKVILHLELDLPVASGAMDTIKFAALLTVSRA
jgi:hypothetical protein